jgi:transcriptional accessory protein Tex/SPT6
MSESVISNSNSNTLQIARQVAVSANGGDSTGIQNPTDPNEIQQLSLVIRTWRELQKEVDEMNSALKEKKKRMKALEEMILRIMKKNNIGALDLQSSGGRLLYRRQTTKGPLGQKDLARLLGEHLKSDQKAAEALQYVAEHRGAKVKESLQYEKE